MCERAKDERFYPGKRTPGRHEIGLAATLLLLLNGRISGISGIVGGLVSPGARKGGDAGWRAAFGVGLVLGAFFYAAAAGGLAGGVEASVPVLVWDPAAPAATASAA